MKRVIIVLIILATTSLAGNAQFFIEGNIGVTYNSDYRYDTSQSNPANFSFDISPQVGYWLNDHIAVGTTVSLRQRILKDIVIDPDNPDQKIEQRFPGWEFAVFGRYKLWGKENFSLLVESSIFIDGSSVKEKNGSNTKKIQSESTFGLSVYPLISYDLTDKFSIITTCSFLSLDLSSHSIKDEDTGTKNRYNHFGFNAQSTVFESLANIQIGFIYNF